MNVSKIIIANFVSYGKGIVIMAFNSLLDKVIMDEMISLDTYLKYSSREAKTSEKQMKEL